MRLNIVPVFVHDEGVNNLRLIVRCGLEYQRVVLQGMARGALVHISNAGHVGACPGSDGSALSLLDIRYANINGLLRSRLDFRDRIGPWLL